MWYVYIFFFKQKTAYEMRISDWSSDVCSSDLRFDRRDKICIAAMRRMHPASYDRHVRAPRSGLPFRRLFNQALFGRIGGVLFWQRGLLRLAWLFAASALAFRHWERSEEHTSELQSLMRYSYAVFGLKQKNN